jgi:hypothetical protein
VRQSAPKRRIKPELSTFRQFILLKKAVRAKQENRDDISPPGNENEIFTCFSDRANREITAADHHWRQ